jgi:hypothetical protein
LDRHTEASACVRGKVFFFLDLVFLPEGTDITGYRKISKYR